MISTNGWRKNIFMNTGQKILNLRMLLDSANNVFVFWLCFRKVSTLFEIYVKTSPKKNKLLISTLF
jgi:hypothetical protein